LVSHSVKLLLVLASTVSFVYGSVGTNDNIFVILKTFTFVEVRPHLQREEETDYSWSLPFYWGVALLDLTLTHSPSATTHSFIHSSLTD
jgi:hypothetical protein